MNTITVIIVTCNSASTISTCLKSVFSESSQEKDFQVIAVDNASTDQTKRIVAGEFPQVTLIENETNLGFAAAINRGAAAAKGTHLLLLNPDTIVQNSFIRRLLDFLQVNHLAAVVGCNLVDNNGRHQPSCWKKPGLRTLLLETFLPYKISLPLVTDNPTLFGEVKMVSGACMAVRREVFERLGGFDAQFFLYYEDADFCFRTRKAGYKVLFNPGISVFHQGGGIAADRHVLLRHFYKSKNIFFRKHFQPLYASIAHRIIVAGIALRIPVYWTAGRILFNDELLRLSKYHNFVRERGV